MTRITARRSSLAAIVTRTALYGLLVLLSFTFILPFLWGLVTSLKVPNQIYIFPPTFVPRPVAIGNWLEVWSIVPLARFFGNTAVVTFFALIGQLLSSSLVAYGFARFRFPFRNLLFLMVLSVLMLPPIVYLIPQYVLFNKIGWIDTFLPLIMPWWFSAGSGGAFSIFLLRQFYSTIPREMDEAAMIDGAGYFTIWWRIILPLSKPALAALTIFGFVWHWNDFLEPLIYLQSTENFTISVGLQFLQSAGFTGFGASPITEHYLMAAALLACLPPLVLFLIAQRWFIEGINLTGTKG